MKIKRYTKEVKIRPVIRKMLLTGGLLVFTVFIGFTGSNIAEEKMNDYTIDNCITAFSMQKTEPAKSGWFFWFTRESFTEGVNLKMSYVDRQTETHPPHRHFDKEIYYILEGDAEVFLNGQTKVIGPNSSMFCPSYSLHGIKRANEKPLKYLVIRAGKKDPNEDAVPEETSEYTLDDCVTVFSENNVDKAKTGWYFWFAPKSLTEGLNLKMTYVDKLTSTHPPHQHPGEEILFLLEGQAEIYLNGETKIIQPNTSIYYPDSSLHCIKRVNDQPIKYLVINP